MPKLPSDRCALFDLFNEVLILDKFRHEGGICRLYDYGVDAENYYIVMKMYRCNLRQWRLNDRRPLHQQLPIYLHIFRKFSLSHSLSLSPPLHRPSLPAYPPLPTLCAPLSFPP